MQPAGQPGRGGTAHAAFARSTVPHAELAGVDATGALRLPGVLRVLSGADLAADTRPLSHQLPWPPARPPARPPEWPLLATDRVRHAGEPVAVVVAEDPYTAADAADLVEVTYRELPAVLDTTQAMTPGAPQLYPEWESNVFLSARIEHGDVDAAFRAADMVLEETFTGHRQLHRPRRGTLPRRGRPDERGRDLLRAGRRGQSPGRHRQRRGRRPRLHRRLRLRDRGRPAGLLGQLQGGFGQALSATLFERLDRVGAATPGALAPASLAAYPVARAAYVPALHAESMPTGSSVPGGVRGAGQLTTVLAPAAIANAVEAALHGHGARIRDSYLGPAAIRRLVAP